MAKKTRSAQQTPALSHVDSKGEALMVDVGAKTPTHRVAIAQADVLLSAATQKLLRQGTHAKGDVLAAARIAGIMAAKKTGDLIPLCHPLRLDHVRVDLKITRRGIRILARAETRGVTGVEMEAMTAASVAALTLYDMLKASDKGIVIESVMLIEKRGGKSGTWKRHAS